MKKHWLKVLAVALAALMLLTACTGGDGPATDTSGQGTEPAATEAPATQAGTSPSAEAPETEAPQPEEPVTTVDLTATALSVEDGGVTLGLSTEITGEGLTDGALTVSLLAGEEILHTENHKLEAGELTLTLPCDGAALDGELTVMAFATEGEEELDTVYLLLKNRLPQLTADGVRFVVDAMTLEEKAHLVTGVKDTVRPGASGGTYPIQRLGVPSVTVNDGPAGVRYNTAVWYPSIINVSSSWDPALSEQVGAAIGDDALALGIDIVLAPGMNIQKNVLCGRNFEYSSEDPILTALMVAPYVQGMQATGAGACLKHYAANNQEIARGTVSANVTERALREIYLKAFGMVVDMADPFTVMSSYNCLNGTHTSINGDLLTDILRGEFGFRGFVMSDWGAAGSMKDKVNAMNDLNMPGNETDPMDVMEAYSRGEISVTALNACCYNILSVVERSAIHQGLYETRRVLKYAEHGKLTATAAADTMVLLQNEGDALPLAAGTSVAVFGNGSFKTVFGGAGSGGVTPRKTVNFFDGIRACESLEVYNEKGNPFRNCSYHSADDPSLDVVVTEAYAKEMAAGADVALIVISRGSTEGADRNSLEGDFKLNATERDMIDRVSAAFHAEGKKVVVALNIGSPMEMVSWQESVDAILWCGYPGQEAGTALASVLTGEVNPSAKTTITWPTAYNTTPAVNYFPGDAYDTVYYEDIYVGYRYYSTFGVDVAYPFGYGLSYTEFAYSDFSVTKNSDGTLTAKVTVTNTGDVAGREVVQLYVTKPETLQEQAALELATFGKTGMLAPGASETLTLTVTPEALMTYDTENSRWIYDKGEYTLSLAASAADIKDTAKISFDEVTVILDVENECIPDAEFPIITKETYNPDAATRENLAEGKPTTSNHDEENYTSDKAVDGDPVTRWSGLGLSGKNHLWTVDLGKTYRVGEVSIAWESLNVPFSVYTSTDGENFVRYGQFVRDNGGGCVFNLYGTEARYIRLDIPSGQYVSIFEFRAYEATEEEIEHGTEVVVRTNVAKGKPVTSTTCEGNLYAHLANDGDYSTRWGSQPTGEAYLILDLEEVTAVKGMMLSMEAAWVPYFIEYSVDGEEYTVLRACANNEVSVVLEELDIEARYFRFRRDGESWFSIFEIEIYVD